MIVGRGGCLDIVLIFVWDQILLQRDFVFFSLHHNCRVTLADIGALRHLYVQQENTIVNLCQASFLLTAIMASLLFLIKTHKMGRIGVIVSGLGHKSLDFEDRGLCISAC